MKEEVEICDTDCNEKDNIVNNNEELPHLKSVLDVFDKCVQKVDGSFIKDSRILKILFYPVMVYFHFYMVKFKC